jgi:hypothetical protein
MPVLNSLLTFFYLFVLNKGLNSPDKFLLVIDFQNNAVIDDVICMLVQFS